MDRFIAEANIKHFKRRLAEETDPNKRKVLQDMLEAEKAALAELIQQKKDDLKGRA